MASFVETPTRTPEVKILETTCQRVNDFSSAIDSAAPTKAKIVHIASTSTLGKLLLNAENLIPKETNALR
jgi:hypothetical protein